MLDNVVTGQVFMAIENIHSKCVEIDNSIKTFRGGKKAEAKPEAEFAKTNTEAAHGTLVSGFSTGKSKVRSDKLLTEKMTSTLDGKTTQLGISRFDKHARTRAEDDVKKEKNTDNDMLSLAVANEKLKYVFNSLVDFREILKKDKHKQ